MSVAYTQYAGYDMMGLATNAYQSVPSIFSGAISDMAAHPQIWYEDSTQWMTYTTINVYYTTHTFCRPVVLAFQAVTNSVATPIQRFYSAAYSPGYTRIYQTLVMGALVPTYIWFSGSVVLSRWIGGGLTADDVWWSATGTFPNWTFTPQGVNTTVGHPYNFNVVMSRAPFIGWSKSGSLTGFYTGTSIPAGLPPAMFVGARRLSTASPFAISLTETVYKAKGLSTFTGTSTTPALTWTMTTAGTVVGTYTTGGAAYGTYVCSLTMTSVYPPADLSGVYTRNNALPYDAGSPASITLTCTCLNQTTARTTSTYVTQAPILL